VAVDRWSGVGQRQRQRLPLRAAEFGLGPLRDGDGGGSARQRRPGRWDDVAAAESVGSRISTSRRLHARRPVFRVLALGLVRDCGGPLSATMTIVPLRSLRTLIAVVGVCGCVSMAHAQLRKLPDAPYVP